jgi:hypothetical protein
VFERDERLAEFLRDFALRRKINFVLLQDFFVNEGLQKIVDVVAAKMCVAVG